MIQKPTILHLVTQAEWGGAQKYVYELAVRMRDEFRMVVAAGELKKSNELISRLARAGIETVPLHHVVRNINPWEDSAGLFELIAVIRRVRPSCVHLHASKMSVLGSIAAYLSGVRSVMYTAHGWVFLQPEPSFVRAFFRVAERATALLKTKIIVLSKRDRDAALRAHIVAPEKLEIIPNGVDEQSLELLPRERARGMLQEILSVRYKKKKPPAITAETFIVGTIANLYPNKGLTYLIDGAEEVLRALDKKNHPGRVMFVVIGEGNERHALEARCAERGLDAHVFFPGALPMASRVLSAFDIFVLPSVKEGFPFALLEAMTAKLPIVATTVGAITEIIESGKEGILVPPGDATALGEALLELIHHSDRRAALGDAAYVKATSHFTLQKMTSRIAHLYHACCSVPALERRTIR